LLLDLRLLDRGEESRSTSFERCDCLEIRRVHGVSRGSSLELELVGCTRIDLGILDEVDGVELRLIWVSVCRFFGVQELRCFDDIEETCEIFESGKI